MAPSRLRLMCIRLTGTFADGAAPPRNQCVSHKPQEPAPYKPRVTLGRPPKGASRMVSATAALPLAAAPGGYVCTCPRGISSPPARTLLTRRLQSPLQRPGSLGAGCAAWSAGLGRAGEGSIHASTTEGGCAGVGRCRAFLDGGLAYLRGKRGLDATYRHG